MNLDAYEGNREALDELLSLCKRYRLTHHLNLSATNLNDLIPNLVITILVNMARYQTQSWRRNLGRLFIDLPPQRFDDILSHLSSGQDDVALEMAEGYGNGESLWKKALSLPVDAPVTPENCQYVLLSRRSSNELHGGERYDAYIKMVLAKGGYTISASNLAGFAWRYYLNYNDDDVKKILLNSPIEPPESLVKAFRNDPEVCVDLMVSLVKADLRTSPNIVLPPTTSFAQMRPIRSLLFQGYAFKFDCRLHCHKLRQLNQIPCDEDSAFWTEMVERDLRDILGYEYGFNLDFFNFTSIFDSFYDRYLLRNCHSIFTCILHSIPTSFAVLTALLKFGWETPLIESLHLLEDEGFRSEFEWYLGMDFMIGNVSTYRRLFFIIKPFNLEIKKVRCRDVLLDMMHHPDLYWQRHGDEVKGKKEEPLGNERMEWIKGQLEEIERKLAERTSLLLALVNNRLDLVPPFDGKPAELSDLPENPVLLARIFRAYPREHLRIILRNLLEASLAPMVMTVNIRLLNIFVRVYAPDDILNTCLHPVIKRLLSVMLHLHPRVRSCYGDQVVFKSSLEFRDWILTRLCCIRQPQIKMILLRYYFCNLADSRYQRSHFLTQGQPFGLGLRAERVIKGELSFMSDDDDVDTNSWIFN